MVTLRINLVAKEQDPWASILCLLLDMVSTEIGTL